MKQHKLVFFSSVMAIVFITAALITVNVVAAEEAYPSKPIQFIINLAPGGYGDFTARTVAQKLSESLGQPVVVVNKPGAGMILSAMAALQNPADGYTLAMTGGGMALSAALFKKLPYDVLTDFDSVALMVSTDLLLLVKADSKFTSLADVVAFAKSNPGKLNLGCSYVGSTQNLAAELFKKFVGIDAEIVAYKSPPQVILSLMAGTVDFAVDFAATSLSHIKNKKVRAIAIAAKERFPGLPDTPTTAEAGFPGYEVRSWNAIGVKTGTPRAIIDRLNKEVQTALKDPDVKQKLNSKGLNPLFGTPEDMRALSIETKNMWAKVIEEFHIPRR